MLDMIDGWHRGECNGMELLLYKTMCKYICFGYYLLQRYYNSMHLFPQFFFSQQNINVVMIKTAKKTQKYL